MQRLFKGLNAVIGFAGSSESPEKFSMRLMGVTTALFSQVLPVIGPLILMLGVEMPNGVSLSEMANTLIPLFQVAFLFVGAVIWFIGAARAFWKAYNLGGKLGGYMRG